MRRTPRSKGEVLNVIYIYIYIYIYIQCVSGGKVNILGGASMEYSEYIISYKLVSNFQWM